MVSTVAKVDKNNDFCVGHSFFLPLLTEFNIVSMNTESQAIFDKNTIEFVTVAAEFCAFLERAEQMERRTFVSTSLKILPLLYLKASLLPPVKMLGEEMPETYVTEDTYELIRLNLLGVLGEQDDFLDVFVDDMKYSDQPIKCSISETLADIYQDIKDFIFVFQLGLNETMNDALFLCRENFGNLWGQKTVNVLRALHEAYYNADNDEDACDCCTDSPNEEDEHPTSHRCHCHHHSHED